MKSGLVLKDILPSEFLDNLDDTTITVIKVSAQWCGPCKKIIPYVESLFQLTQNNVRLFYVDADENERLCHYWRIQKLPTFISYVGKDKTDILESADKVQVLNFFQKVELHSKLLSKVYKNNI